MLKTTQKNTIIDLSGVWKYKVEEEGTFKKLNYFKPTANRSGWKDMKVPHNWYLTELGDFFGAVWFEKEFELGTNLKGRNISLKFSAVDYYADVWLNGKFLGHHEGYFTPFEFDVTDIVKYGDKNILVVRDDAPRDPTEYVMCGGASSAPLSNDYKNHWAKELTMIKGHHIDAMHRPGAMTKFRGDGNSGGIWQKVEILASEAIRITDKKVYCRIVEEDGSALVSVDLTVFSKAKEMIETKIGMTVKPNNFKDKFLLKHEKSIQVQPGINVIKLVKTIEKPKLWWTWDHGFPYLYQAEFVIGDTEIWDSAFVRFGIKNVVHNTDDSHFYLNGKKVFLRGMRYLSSLWISEMNKGRYKEDLVRMLDLSINSVRIGSHVEKDEFYDLCDEMGLLVWQVFPMHYCYSDSDALIEKTAPMMKKMVEMLYNHASIGMWSVFKEPKIYGLPDKPNNYGRLCQILIETAKTVDPIRWMHSGDYEEKVQNITIGQCYPWDTDLKKKKIEPIIVEFGTGALAHKAAMLKIMPENELWPPNWDQWQYYCFFYDISFNAAKIDMGSSLDEFIDNYQSYQARCIKEQIEFCRQDHRNKPVGSMWLYYWCDAWNSIGVSGLLDYFRTPFKSYYAFKQVYTPVLVSLEWNRDPYIVGKQKHYGKGETFAGNLWLTNDRLEDIKGMEVTWKLMEIASGTVVKSDKKTHDIAQNSSRIAENVIWEIPKTVTPGEYVVEMEVKDRDNKRLSYNDFHFEVH